MNRTVLLITATSLLIAIFPVFGQSEETPEVAQGILSIKTDQSIYNENDTVVISGNVTAIIFGTPVTIQVFHGGTVIEVAQLEVAQDGKFTHTMRAEGPLWQKDGVYTIRASYSAKNIAEATFNYQTEKDVPETYDTYEVDAGSSGTFDVEYAIKGGTVKEMKVEPNIFGIIVTIESEEANGYITVDLPRQSIDAKKSDGTDDVYIILIDGVQVPFEETTNPNSRIITVQFEKGDSKIEIIGTFVIPEFGVLPTMTLMLAIVLTSLFSIKKRIFQIR